MTKNYLLIFTLMFSGVLTAAQADGAVVVAKPHNVAVKRKILHNTRKFRHWLTPGRAALVAALVAAGGLASAAGYGWTRARYEDLQELPPHQYHWLNPVGWGYQRFRATHHQRPEVRENGFIGPMPLRQRTDVEKRWRDQK